MMTLTIDEQILLNRSAMGYSSLDEAVDWFGLQQNDKRRVILRWVAAMLQQAHAIPADTESAILQSGLGETFAPCTILRSLPTRVAVWKIANLSGTDERRSIRLLLSLLGIAERRNCLEGRRRPERHWWHRDLSSDDVINCIRRKYGTGSQ